MTHQLPLPWVPPPPVCPNTALSQHRGWAWNCCFAWTFGTAAVRVRARAGGGVGHKALVLVCGRRLLASRHCVRVLSPEDPPKPLCCGCVARGGGGGAALQKTSSNNTDWPLWGVTGRSPGEGGGPHPPHLPQAPLRVGTGCSRIAGFPCSCSPDPMLAYDRISPRKWGGGGPGRGRAWDPCHWLGGSRSKRQLSSGSTCSASGPSLPGVTPLDVRDRGITCGWAPNGGGGLCGVPHHHRHDWF